MSLTCNTGELLKAPGRPVAGSHLLWFFFSPGSLWVSRRERKRERWWIMEVGRNTESGGTLEVKSESRRNHNRRLRTELVDKAPPPAAPARWPHGSSLRDARQQREPRLLSPVSRTGSNLELIRRLGQSLCGVQFFFFPPFLFHLHRANEKPCRCGTLSQN